MKENESAISYRSYSRHQCCHTVAVLTSTVPDGNFGLFSLVKPEAPASFPLTLVCLEVHASKVSDNRCQQVKLVARVKLRSKSDSHDYESPS